MISQNADTLAKVWLILRAMAKDQADVFAKWGNNR
jgi:hypothetical protein